MKDAAQGKVWCGERCGAGMQAFACLRSLLVAGRGKGPMKGSFYAALPGMWWRLQKNQCVKLLLPSDWQGGALYIYV